jgi:hypothetical protein
VLTTNKGVAVIMLGSYAAGLLFSQHSDLFDPSRDEEDHGASKSLPVVLRASSAANASPTSVIG